MGLAAPQVQFLALTKRKGVCTRALTRAASDKMALTREVSNLSKEYNSRLRSKDIAYYANGKYNKINYNYIMGYGKNYAAIFDKDNYPIKGENSMILTNFKGQVVLSDSYAKAITDVVGSSVMDKNGSGKTFSADKIPEILAALCPGFNADTFRSVMNKETVSSSYNANSVDPSTGEVVDENVVVDNSDTVTDKVQQIVDFYLPIFKAASANGWTTEYNKEMGMNGDYTSDALVSGLFQLETVDETGEYDEGSSLSYFITAGLVQENTSSDEREEITAWYNAEKDRLSEKETFLEIQMTDWSTELEAINTELETLKSFIEDGMSVFEWGG